MDERMARRADAQPEFMKDWTASGAFLITTRRSVILEAVKKLIDGETCADSYRANPGEADPHSSRMASLKSFAAATFR